MWKPQWQLVLRLAHFYSKRSKDLTGLYAQVFVYMRKAGCPKAIIGYLGALMYCLFVSTIYYTAYACGFVSVWRYVTFVSMYIMNACVYVHSKRMRTSWLCLCMCPCISTYVQTEKNNIHLHWAMVMRFCFIFVCTMAKIPGSKCSLV